MCVPQVQETHAPEGNVYLPLGVYKEKIHPEGWI